MATNKHAQIRYQVLNKCFSNFQRRFYIEDLIEACNMAIYEYDGKEEGVKRRQIFYDIDFMESEVGWAIPLIRHKDGKRIYYRYSDKNFSINKHIISETEANQLRDTLMFLSKFQGMPQFEWIYEIIIRIQAQFNLTETETETENIYVSFEQNPYLSGLQYFSILFNAIQNKTVIKIKYKGFKQIESQYFNIHPYYLKQYNNRWFLLGWNEEFNEISNLAFDRIIDIEEIKKQYRNNDLDFSEYFEDVIGVTITKEPVEEIIIKIESNLWPYIESKPIHGSQTVIEKTDKNVLIKLKVQINYELVSLLLSYGAELIVIKPEVLRNRITAILDKSSKDYSV